MGSSDASRPRPTQGSEAVTLSNDAIVFGLGFLSGPKSTLSFGGDGAEYRITDRGRAALDELIKADFCEPCEPKDSIPYREHYRGKGHIGAVAKEQGFSPFAAESWPTFEKVRP